MKLWLMAGLFTAAAIPFAGAAEASAECQVDDSRRLPHVRIDSGGPGGSAPAPVARPAQNPPEENAGQVAQREVAQPERTATAERRRSGKHVPDAELIAPRGAL